MRNVINQNVFKPVYKPDNWIEDISYFMTNAANVGTDYTATEPNLFLFGTEKADGKDIPFTKWVMTFQNKKYTEYMPTEDSMTIAPVLIKNRIRVYAE